jgi:dihydropyrimidinase
VKTPKSGFLVSVLTTNDYDLSSLNECVIRSWMCLPFSDTLSFMNDDFDVLIRNASVAGPGGHDAIVDVGIIGGRIAAFGVAGTLASGAANMLDAEGRTVVPGVIDPHVHFGNGPQSVAEDLLSETRMAVAGGVTTVCPYLITAGSYDDILRELKTAVAELSLVDVFPQVGIVSVEQVSEVSRLHRLFGIRAFKCFMGYKGAEASPSGIRGIDDASILDLMVEVAKIPGGRLAVHAENMEVIDAARTRVQSDEPEGTLASWTRARPRIAETEAIGRVLQFARATRCPITIPHMSVGRDVALLRGHARGVDAVFETCPHFLLLSDQDDVGVWGKANPPLRGLDDQSALWTELKTGAIDVLGSDHCPFDATTKGADGTIWNARPGIPNGSAVILPMMFDRLAHDDGITSDLITRLTSANAADRYALANKGALTLGADADLAIVDTERASVFDSASFGGIATHSPYDGRTFGSTVWATIAGGEIVFLNGQTRQRQRTARVLVRADGAA